MGQVLEALHRLQEVELKLAKIRGEADSKSSRVRLQKRQVQLAEERLRESMRTIRERQVRLDALQLDVSSREEQVARHRQALNVAKTNKEYAAVLTAMNTEKADTAKLETEMLQLMEELQTLKDDSAKVESERSVLEQRVADAEARLRAFEEKFRPEQDALQAKRESYSSGLDPVILASFTRVAEHHEGEAMVPVSRLHPKREEYLCGGCNLQITLEVVNALQTRNEIQQCKSCGRILFLNDTLVIGRVS